MKKATMKLASCIMALMMLLAPITAFAATGLDANETKILADARAAASNFTLSAGQQAKLDVMFSEAETYLSQDYSMSDDDYAKVSANIATVVAELPSDLSKVSISSLYASSSALMGAVDSVANVFGVTIDLSGNGSITVKGAKDKVVTKTENTVKQTGTDATYLIIIAFGFLSVIAGCAVIAKKKNLFAVKS